MPIFAPIIYGTAAATANRGSSPKVPAATIPTTSEVVVDELWIKPVARMPMNNPINALALLSNKASANSRPNPLNAVPIIPMLTKNKYNTAMTALIFSALVN